MVDVPTGKIATFKHFAPCSSNTSVLALEIESMTFLLRQ
jgi:hypothetical protein